MVSTAILGRLRQHCPCPSSGHKLASSALNHCARAAGGVHSVAGSRSPGAAQQRLPHGRGASSVHSRAAARPAGVQQIRLCKARLLTVAMQQLAALHAKHSAAHALLSCPDSSLWARLHLTGWLTVVGCTCRPSQGEASGWGPGAMPPRHAVHRPWWRMASHAAADSSAAASTLAWLQDSSQLCNACQHCPPPVAVSE